MPLHALDAGERKALIILHHYSLLFSDSAHRDNNPTAYHYKSCAYG